MSNAFCLSVYSFACPFTVLAYPFTVLLVRLQFCLSVYRFLPSC